MTSDRIPYESLVESRLRQVIFDCLKLIETDGLPGGHHFYITFRTDHPDCDLPGYLRERYPEDMTVVLQYEFYNLEVHHDHFLVDLSFSGRSERLCIPYNAVTVFADPSVNFVLQFEPDYDRNSGDRLAKKDLNVPKTEIPGQAAQSRPGINPRDPKAPQQGGAGNVVPLDRFRKK